MRKSCISQGAITIRITLTNFNILAFRGMDHIIHAHEHVSDSDTALLKFFLTVHRTNLTVNLVEHC